MQPDTGIVKLVVTGRWPHVARQIKSALRKAVPGARIRSAGFRSVFILEAAGDVLELAQRINRDCAEDIGHATPALIEVETKLDAIKDAAVKIGTERIGVEESFCFRLFKRGMHGLGKNTPRLEYEIGGAVGEALQLKNGKKPVVNLDEPDSTVVAEVLGPVTMVGVLKKAWRTVPSEQADKGREEHEKSATDAARATPIAKAAP
jgi:tRNA(Ser,Leu) C12 N-acetylase TAN1